MSLSGDAGVGDTGGDNEETMRIVRLDDMKKVWIFCWEMPDQYTQSTCFLERGKVKNDNMELSM